VYAKQAPPYNSFTFVLFDFTLTNEEMALLTSLDRKEPLIGKLETLKLVEFSLTW
jgi:hypothetical protein